MSANRLRKSILACWFVLLPLISSTANAADGLNGKIAFLKDGEVWTVDRDGNQLRQVTNDSGKVDAYLFSPSLKYLAYTRILRYADEPGLWDDSEKVPQTPVCSIKIMNLETDQVVKEIEPTEDGWIYISKWLPGDKLFYYGSSGFDVSGFYVYDLTNGKSAELDYNVGSTLSETTYSRSGKFKLYVDDSGLGKEYRQHLHMMDMTSMRDVVVVSKKSICEQALSNDDERVAFIEVENVGGKYIDNLWICDIKTSALSRLYTGPAKPMVAGVSEISWSPDDRYVGMFFTPDALVLDSRDTGTIARIEGGHFSWVDNDRILLSRKNDICIYSLNTGTCKIVYADAAMPVFLVKHEY